MSAYRFINLLMVIAALAFSAGAAYVFFGRTEIDQVEARLSIYEQRIETQRRLAEVGDVKAQYLLGRLLRFGKGRTQNVREAVKWFNSAAARGHSGAQYELGTMYARGEGVGQSYHRAVEWLGLAARVGRHRSAQFALGELYYLGRGVDTDYVDALSWFQKAAQRKHPLAQFYLGEMYEKGWGVKRDLIEAFKWYSLAARKNQEVAKNIEGRDPESLLRMLKRQMNKSQLAAGERAVKAWKPTQ